MFNKSMVGILFVLILILLLTTQTVFANFSNGPENPGGAIVIRYQDVLLVSTEDYKAELTAIHNGDIIAFCLGEEEPVVLQDFQDIFSPSHEERILGIVHGEDIPTTVWDFAADWDADFCAEFLSREPLAVGTVKFRSTDNDIYAWTYTDNNWHNAFGWTSQGKLYDADGELVHFNSVFRAVWDGVTGESFKFTSKINLK